MSSTGETIFFAPLRQAVIGPDGLMTRPWVNFFQSLWLRTGGTTAPTPTDILTQVPQGLGVPELVSQDAAMEARFGSLPTVVPSDPPADTLFVMIASLQDQIAELQKQVDGLKLGTAQLTS